MRYLICFALVIGTYSSYGQLKENYQNALDSITGELAGTNCSFKRAVFWAENASFNNQLSFEKFDAKIAQMAKIVSLIERHLTLKTYHYPDSTNLVKNYAIFKFMKDTTRVRLNSDTTLLFLPYTYDFTDFDGKQNWANMFVTKLLATQMGNCHNLPFLYKILADEIGATCWLSLAPNHIYIKNRCKGSGWYNTELTSGSFPIDAWITTPGYVSLKAIQSGIYMDTLSNRQAIALCVLDLAKSYEHQFKDYEDGFILSCCNLVLQYHPVNVQALLLKAETVHRIYIRQASEKDSDAQATYRQMEQLYTELLSLGYREMPEQMYLNWLQSLKQEEKKYSNHVVQKTLGRKEK